MQASSYSGADLIQGLPFSIGIFSASAAGRMLPCLCMANSAILVLMALAVQARVAWQSSAGTERSLL